MGWKKVVNLQLLCCTLLFQPKLFLLFRSERIKMKKQIIIAIASILPLLVSAQSVVTLPLWDNAHAPSGNGVTLLQTDKGVYWENVTSAVMTVYRPEHPNGLAVLACPGGSYLQIWEREFHNIAKWYNEQGILLAVLRYRIPNGHKEVPMDDINKAMKTLREHQSEYGFTKLGVHGNSAGGHLASTAATHYTSLDLRPDFQILFYPVISMDSLICHKPSRDNLLGQNPSAEDIAFYSNERHVTKDTPPAFIATSGTDPHVSVNNSIAYYKALLEHGVPACLHIYPSGGHGWFNKSDFNYRNMALEELKLWLQGFVKK